jgi:preprotein translocase subunit SecG
MSLFITLLTIVLVLDCLLLILLILVQLPKKEAGLGQAFGSGTTDALFGAGSGNALTKMTKYAAGVFFALALLLTILNGQANPEKKRSRSFEERFNQRPGGALQVAPSQTAKPVVTNQLKTAVGATNLSLGAPGLSVTNK